MARIFGIDYGGKWIGVAMSDESETLASGFGTVENEGVGDAAARIAEMAEERGVAEIVVGWPVGMKGTETEQTKETGEFVRELREVVEIPVETFDERLTSSAAEQLGGGKEKIHEKSAVIILQNYLDRKK